MWDLGNYAVFSTFAKDLLQILILSVILYRVYVALAETKALQIIVIAVVYSLVFFLVYILDLEFFYTLFKMFTLPFVLLMAVVYHPELKRAASSIFSHQRRSLLKGSTTTDSQVETILTACQQLVAMKRGALIVLPRHMDLRGLYEEDKTSSNKDSIGTVLNAELTDKLIRTVFDHDTPLHDGAMIIQGNMIIAAGCVLPVSQRKALDGHLGTRHRAALGLAEESDAVILIVSEESGALSLAYNANIYYKLSASDVKRSILSLMSYHDIQPDDGKKMTKEGNLEYAPAK